MEFLRDGQIIGGGQRAVAQFLEVKARHPARRVVVKGASQMLKTQVALCWLMASAHRAPANMLVLEPTTDLAKRLSARVQKARKG